MGKQRPSSTSAVADSSNDRPPAVGKELRDDSYESLKRQDTSVPGKQKDTNVSKSVRKRLAKLRHRSRMLSLRSRMKRQREVQSDGDAQLKSDPPPKQMSKLGQSSTKKAEAKSDMAEWSAVDDEPVCSGITVPQRFSPSATCPAGPTVVHQDRTPNKPVEADLAASSWSDIHLRESEWSELMSDFWFDMTPLSVASQVNTLPRSATRSPELPPVIGRQIKRSTTTSIFAGSQPSCSSSHVLSVQASNKMSEDCLPDSSDSTDSDCGIVALGSSMMSEFGKSQRGHGLRRRRRAKKAHVNASSFRHDHDYCEKNVYGSARGIPGETGWGYSQHHISPKEDGINLDYLSSPFDLKSSDGSRRNSDDAGPSYYSRVNRFESMSLRSESASGGDSDAQMEMGVSITDLMERQSVRSLYMPQSMFQPLSDRSRSEYTCLARSHSVPSLSGSVSLETFLRSESLPSMVLKNSFEEFTPEFDDEDETYCFQCSCPGLYHCSVTGLMFQMEGEDDVEYRITPWDRNLLAQHHKQPAGPLFDIKCTTQSVRQLHLPHCEIRSTGGCGSLSVAHVNDDVIEVLQPHQVTETHVVINVFGFSAFGNIKDDEPAPEPVRALVLLFYKPPTEPDLTSLLNVLLLPRNIVLQHVVRSRKKLNGDEIYLETSPHCKLQPKKEYTLSTRPEDDSVLVQPTEAEFDCDNYDNYFPSFQVDLEKVLKHLTLSLGGADCQSIWVRRVCLSSTGGKRPCRSVPHNLPPDEKLLCVRSGFVEGISAPVLKGLLDNLFDKRVITDSERQSAVEMTNQQDRARFVIDTTRKKGEAASSEMIDYLCNVDPFLCDHLELT